jgi:hypothetical protein
MRHLRFLAALCAALVVSAGQLSFTFDTWKVGDVLAGLGDPFKLLATASKSDSAETGLIVRYSTSASPLDRLTEPDNWYTTGCAYYPDPSKPELWTTAFTSSVNVFNPSLASWSRRIDVTAHSDGAVESLAFAPDGSVFVATPWASGAQLHHYTHAGAFIKSYPNLPGGGADWVDIAVENGDIVAYYTAEAVVEQYRGNLPDYDHRIDAGEASGVYKINITRSDSTGTIVAERVATIADRKAWALRVLPNRQGILVAGTNVVFWLGLDGHVVRTYAIPGALNFFALNIAPDGRSFWTATAPEAIDNAGHTPSTGIVFKVDIASGAVLRRIDTAHPAVGGLCVVREYTAAFNACTADDGTAIACPLLEACTGETGDVDGDGIVDRDARGRILGDDDNDGLSDTQDPDCAVRQAAPNQAPVCSAAFASQRELWPPNHQWEPIAILGVTDPDGDSLTTTITGIFQDEWTNNTADGNTPVDGAGVGTPIAQVRAERTGDPKNPGNGRVYEIRFRTTDASGASCTGSVTVGVPHDQSKGHVILDDGVRYDSTVPTAPPARLR